MASIGSEAMAYASEAYSASLAKSAQQQEGQQSLSLIESAAVQPITPPASSGAHITTDVLGQHINIRV
ncbi:hypothetical protein ACUM5Y_13800 [Marinomonas dokdonensis]|uniref:hypothetical protein n=1 Tax=Marinomonas dokdonensis TaxID=328224 RepID=UPI00405561BD